MDKYNIEAAYLDYLKMVKLDIKTMSPIQFSETKRAFFAGCGYLYRAFGRTVELDIESADEILLDLEKQIETFWLQETGNAKF